MDHIQKVDNPETTVQELSDICDDLKNLADVFSNLVKNADKAADEVKQTKTNMHDCKIPKNVENRDVDIKKYLDKLEEIEKDFDSYKNLNEE